jgi:thiol-disulfide isomerase/thioredoxin
MGGRAIVVAGLIAGVAAGGLALGGLLLLAPPPPVQESPTPTTASPVPVTPSPAASTSSPAASASASPAGPSAAFGVGEAAPALDVAQLGGGRISLASLQGKPVWVNFMATWCPSCRDELPLMAGYATRYADDGLVVLVIDVREDAATVDAYMRGLGVTLPVGVDVDGVAQGAWGAFALPVHYWIGADGVVRDGALGGIGPDLMTAGLKAIMPGVDVTAP